MEKSKREENPDALAGLKMADKDTRAGILGTPLLCYILRVKKSE